MLENAGLSDGRKYFTRSQLLTSWKAAGVLPFAFHNGQAWVLLGGELSWNGPGRRLFMWSDFGGQREAIDEDAAATASRECSEETLGMLYGSSSADQKSVQQSSVALSDLLRQGDRACICTIHKLKKVKIFFNEPRPKVLGYSLPA